MGERTQGGGRIGVVQLREFPDDGAARTVVQRIAVLDQRQQRRIAQPLVARLDGGQQRFAGRIGQGQHQFHQFAVLLQPVVGHDLRRAFGRSAQIAQPAIAQSR